MSTARLRLSPRFRFALNGIGISKVCLSCCLFSLTLGSAESVLTSSSAVKSAYLSMVLITFILVIISGTLVINASKYAKKSTMNTVLVFSTLSCLSSVITLGLTGFMTSEYFDGTTVSVYTSLALVFECVSASTCFFLSGTSLTMACTASNDNEIVPIQMQTAKTNRGTQTDEKKNISKSQNGVVPALEQEQFSILPLHDVPPKHDATKTKNPWFEDELYESQSRVMTSGAMR